VKKNAKNTTTLLSAPESSEKAEWAEEKNREKAEKLLLLHGAERGVVKKRELVVKKQRGGYLRERMLVSIHFHFLTKPSLMRSTACWKVIFSSPFSLLLIGHIAWL